MRDWRSHMFHAARSRRFALALATLPIAVAMSSVSLASDGHAPTMSLPELTSLWRNARVSTNPNALLGTIPVLPLNAPPINGYQPHVVFGLTDQQDPDEFGFTTKASTSPGGNTLPRFAQPRYSVGIFDTGSQAHLITLADYDAFDVAGANREGSYEAEIGGVSGSEFADISDALGVYQTSIANASTSTGTITVTPGSLKGQWNAAILSARQGSTLPNIIGAPMAAQYQTVLRVSQTRHLNVG